MSNNNHDTVRTWIAEQLDIVDGEDPVTVLVLSLLTAGGDEREIFAMKHGTGKWGQPEQMADVFWGQAHRVAKGTPGFCQFQLVAAGGDGKPRRFLPFGIMGMTQLGPSAGGTAFAGLATEAPNTTGQTGQAMRLTELIVQSSQAKDMHNTTLMTSMLKSLMEDRETMSKRLDEQWLALKQALLDIQNNADSRALKRLYADVARKAVTLLPGLVNALSGKELFPQAVVEKSMIETIAVNFTPEEQQHLVAMVGAHPNGQLLAGVLTNELVNAKRRRDSEASELDRALSGLPSRSYAEGESDAAGNVLRVLQGQSLTPEPKALPTPVTPRPAISTPPSSGSAEASAPDTAQMDAEIVKGLMANMTADQVRAMAAAGMVPPDFAELVLKRFEVAKQAT